MDLTALCSLAARVGASDIHLKAGRPPVVRLHGALRVVPNQSAATEAALSQALRAWMSPVHAERLEAHGSADFAYSVPEVGRFRCSVYRQRGATAAVLRTIPTVVRTIEELQLPNVLRKIALEPRGLVLVTGATGSGKSTTLAALIEEINRSLCHHILTLEDPIEFVFEERLCVVSQREIGVDAPSFNEALRAALRQDPDVLFVGELRDLETAEIALQAAETGHLVLATLHTIDAHESINRIVGMFEPHRQQHVRYQLASVLRASISQRLVPSKTGGRLAATEVLVNTTAIAECIADPKRTREVRDHIRQGRATYGMQTFDQALIGLIRAERIDVEQALRFANNPDELALRLSGLGDDFE